MERSTRRRSLQAPQLRTSNPLKGQYQLILIDCPTTLATGATGAAAAAAAVAAVVAAAACTPALQMPPVLTEDDMMINNVN